MRVQNLAEADYLLVCPLALGIGVIDPIVRNQILRKEHDLTGGCHVGERALA